MSGRCSAYVKTFGDTVVYLEVKTRYAVRERGIKGGQNPVGSIYNVFAPESYPGRPSLYQLLQEISGA